jgi:glycosyltransferase involved in cell wall biosynthesis
VRRKHESSMMPSSNPEVLPRKLRVLILTDEMEVGGTQRQIVHIARGLNRDRFEVTVGYFCNRSVLVDELEDTGIAVQKIAKRSRIDIGFVLHLRRFLRDGSFDVIHCFAFSGELWGAIGRRLVPKAKRPALITSVRSKYEWYSTLQWRIKRWTALESIRVIANSRAGGEHARLCMSLPAGAVDVVYNGVEDISQRVATQVQSRGQPPVTALFVGRLVNDKNVPVLLRAIKRLTTDGIAIRLKIAGDGPMRSTCVDLIESLNIGSHVDMLGERNDAPVLMSMCDMLVSPSFREGLSNVILEAMMMGRPVVASAVGGSVELIEHRVNGLLFPSDDDAALAAAIKALVQDEALRQRLGKTARKHAVERYTLQAMVGTMEQIYFQCSETRGIQRNSNASER